ncbi:MAG TPA: NADAR family protein, partial [Ramlibacter sp.]|nr:NADAR family protein [Ramlibacter sp.]
YGQLSNFWPLARPMKMHGREFATSEHAYQASKYIYAGAPAANDAYVTAIARAKTPFVAKFLGNQWLLSRYQWQMDIAGRVRDHRARGVRARPNWDDSRDEAMRAVLLAKFQQDEACRKVLLNTRGSLLVEASTDAYWGNGARSDGELGHNRLGMLLMEVREELAEAEKK